MVNWLKQDPLYRFIWYYYSAVSFASFMVVLYWLGIAKENSWVVEVRFNDFGEGWIEYTIMTIGIVCVIALGIYKVIEYLELKNEIRNKIRTSSSINGRTKGIGQRRLRSSNKIEL